MHLLKLFNYLRDYIVDLNGQFTAIQRVNIQIGATQG